MKSCCRLVVLTIAASSFTTVSSHTSASHSWNNYHWERSQNPLTLRLGDNTVGDWPSHLAYANDDWNLSSVLDNSIVTGNTSAKRCKPSTGAIEICNDTYGNNGWLGIAGITVSGGHITSGYVKVNDTYFKSSPYNTYEWRQLVMCQEVGHIFGLDHQDENFNNPNLGTCMDYTSDPTTNTRPNDHDYQELGLIYSHSDGSSGGGDGAGSSGCNPRAPWCNGASPEQVLGSIRMDGPAQWGRLVSDHGPMEVYELDLGGGRKIITHVTWTLEHARKHDH